MLMAAPTAHLHPPPMPATAPPHLPLPDMGIKALIDSGLHSVPGSYIFPDSLRPSASQPLLDLHIPVIDLALLEGAEHGRVVQDIGRACKDWGFFQVVNHGVPSALRLSVMEVAREFFALPVEEKMKYHSTEANACVRFGTSFNGSKDEFRCWRDFMRHYCHPVSEFIHLWPDQPAAYRQVVAEYSMEVRSLALRLLAAISESLGLSSDFIDSAFGEHSQILILNHYPPCPNPDLTLGIASHADGTGLTILLQEEVSGLQVRHDGRWVEINPVKDAFVINIGDQLEILTNGIYESVEHRARVNANCSRISIATAYGPSMHTVISPASDLVDSLRPPLYKPITYSEYLKSLYNRGLHGKAMVNSMKGMN